MTLPWVLNDSKDELDVYKRPVPDAWQRPDNDKDVTMTKMCTMDKDLTMDRTWSNETRHEGEFHPDTRS